MTQPITHTQHFHYDQISGPFYFMKIMSSDTKAPFTEIRFCDAGDTRIKILLIDDNSSFRIIQEAHEIKNFAKSIFTYCSFPKEIASVLRDAIRENDFGYIRAYQMKHSTITRDPLSASFGTF